MIKELICKDETFRYQLLSRLKMDCEYFLNYGNRAKNHLWAGNETEQIKTMIALYDSFDEDKKPEWLSLEQIREYERQMLENPIIEKLVLTYVTTDSHNRPTYKDSKGDLFKDIDCRQHVKPDICTVLGGIDSEPDTPIRYIKSYQNREIEFLPERKTIG